MTHWYQKWEICEIETIKQNHVLLRSNLAYTILLIGDFFFAHQDPSEHKCYKRYVGGKTDSITQDEN